MEYCRKCKAKLVYGENIGWLCFPNVCMNCMVGFGSS